MTEHNIHVMLYRCLYSISRLKYHYLITNTHCCVRRAFKPRLPSSGFFRDFRL